MKTKIIANHDIKLATVVIAKGTVGHTTNKVSKQIKEQLAKWSKGAMYMKFPKHKPFIGMRYEVRIPR